MAASAGIEFTTSLGGHLVAGPDGFDHETSFGVFGSYLLGFHGVLNADNFLNSLGLWISTPAFSMPAMGPLMSTGEGGNPKAGAHAFDEHSTSSLVRYLGVRSDGDKVRGIGWQCFDGTQFSFGDYGATSYDLTSFSFAPGESLVTLCVQDSGYGHGSVRRIEFTTSNGGRFAAGAGGFDHETSFSVYGSYLAGFHGMINADNFLSSVGLWISTPTAPVVHPGAARETAAAGNPQAGTTRFDQHSATSPVRYLAVRADGDKVRGIEWQSFDGGTQQFGDCNSVGYTLTSYTFAPDEPLSTLTIKDSGYGRGSVRRIEFTTSRGSFAAGPGGFDHETSLSVHGSYLLGFSGLINVDNFVSSLAAWISPPDPPQLVIDATRRSDAIGNAPAGKTPFDETSAASPIRYLGVRWDGDKIRGMAWEHFDGTRHTSADYDATSLHADARYTFAPDEFLTSLTLKDSGWGHGSVRRIEFRTSNGGVFAAGPDGFDTALSVPAYGSVLLGFYGTVNVDNFLSSLGAYVSAPAAMNGWDYALGFDQRLLNTLMPLLAQINPHDSHPVRRHPDPARVDRQSARIAARGAAHRRAGHRQPADDGRGDANGWRHHLAHPRRHQAGSGRCAGGVGRRAAEHQDRVSRQDGIQRSDGGIRTGQCRVVPDRRGQPAAGAAGRCRAAASRGEPRCAEAARAVLERDRLAADLHRAGACRGIPRRRSGWVRGAGLDLRRGAGAGHRDGPSTPRRGGPDRRWCSIAATTN